MAKEAKPAEEGTAPAPKKSKKLLIIVAALLVVLLLGGGGAAYLLMKKNADDDADADHFILRLFEQFGVEHEELD